MVDPQREIEIVGDRRRAEVMLHPLRLRILDVARTSASAAAIARRLRLKPQKVNYHVRRLAEHGFLRAVEERRAGNVVETVYQSTAEKYVLAARVLGTLAPESAGPASGTVGGLLGLHARAESEIGDLLQATPAGRTIGALSLDAEFRFETAEQRTVFARAVRELFSAIVKKYTSPPGTEEGASPGGRPYRMILGCYPVPEHDAGPTSPSGS